MSKKLVSFTLALILVLSMSALAFADTTPITDNATAEIPVSIRQEFIDDAPEGHYLANLVREEISDEFFRIEGTYLPLVQSASTQVTGTKYIKIYFDTLYPAHIMYYRLDGTFSVPYDGTSATCLYIQGYRQYIYDNSENGGYSFQVTSTYKTYAGNAGRFTVEFDYYWNGTKKGSASDYGSIACDEYGNIY